MQALLALSQLHADFGHVDRALAALMEAVDVDQGAGDGDSLVTCLAQLCALLRAVPAPRSAHAASPAASMQGIAPTHFHMLALLLTRCAEQALEYRLPQFFANALLALGELAATHQTQPKEAATGAVVTELTARGGGRLTYCTADRADGAAAGTAAAPGVERRSRSGVSPSTVVRDFA